MGQNYRSVETMWGADAAGEPLYLKINFSAQTLRCRTRSLVAATAFGAGSILVTGAAQMTMLVDLDAVLRAARLSS